MTCILVGAAGGDVYRDGVLLGRLPLKIQLDPSPFTLELRDDGTTETRTVEPVAGERCLIQF